MRGRAQRPGAGTQRARPGRFGGGRGGGGEWEHGLGGCESGFTLPDLTDTNIVWASCYGNEVTRYDARTKMARSVSPWLHTLDSEPNKAKYRCHWTPPLAIDPFDHNTVYYGCQMILRTTNGGMSWTEIEQRSLAPGPEPHRVVGRDRGRQSRAVLWRGGLLHRAVRGPEGPHLGGHQRRQGLVHARRRQDMERRYEEYQRDCPTGASSPRSSPRISTPAPPTSPSTSTCMDNRDPWIYKTTRLRQDVDARSATACRRGRWPMRASSPRIRIERACCSSGPGNALYYTLDDGVTWKQLQEGLPHAPVSWIVVQKHYTIWWSPPTAAGFYIMDDITPLEQGLMEPNAVDRDREAGGAASGVPHRARRRSAQFSYWLKAPAAEARRVRDCSTRRARRSAR